MTRLVTITVTGADDPAEISGTTTGGVTENDATTTASGTLTISDPDSDTTFTSLGEAVRHLRRLQAGRERRVDLHPGQ